MSKLIEKVARAMIEGEDGDLSPTDKWLARAAIAAVAEWMIGEFSYQAEMIEIKQEMVAALRAAAGGGEK